MDTKNIREEINGRFLYAVRKLLSTKTRGSKISLAGTFGVKPSTFSDILSGRMKAGVDMLFILCDQYQISPDWLLMNRGDMYANNENMKPVNTNIPDGGDNAVIAHFIRLVEQKDSKIICQAEEIGKLKERILQYERQKNTP